MQLFRRLASARLAVSRLVGFFTSRPLLLVITVAGVCAGLLFGGVKTLAWMESPEFCAQCHTMSPEVALHKDSPHETVDCAECHIGSGISGFVKAKLGGIRQTFELVLGSYEKPIPPAAHGMPPPSQTCLRCHNPAQQRDDVLITRSHFQEDEANTEQRLALVVRMSNAKDSGTAGIHWHVLSTVQYVAKDGDPSVIEWIGVTREDGTHEEFIAQNVVDMSGQAGQRAQEVQSTGDVRRMTCYDCHNRVGHAFLTPSRALDDAMTFGSIDTDIPYIKKNAMALLQKQYASVDEADQAVRDLEASYHKDYPYLFVGDASRVNQSFDTLRELYRQTADPATRAQADKYPSYLGHTDSAGCFRCHDGGHFKIDSKGVLSDEAIPSRCSLCHTFPTVGQKSPNVMLGPPPTTHSAKLWVFEHKNDAASSDPSRNVCSSCHSRTYCENCHSSGAKSITHDDMLFNHAGVIRQTGQEPCAYCHQKPFCVRCHKPEDLQDLSLP